MAPPARQSVAALVLAVVAVSVTGVHSKWFNIINKCDHTVWPGISSGAGSAAAPDTTGFELAPGESRAMAVPSGWSGRLWGRTLCSTDSGTGKFACATGDCGSGLQECAGGSGVPPVTLAQFTMDGGSGTGMDVYDVSLVDGYNLPMLVQGAAASARGRNCVPTGCLVDLNSACPAELRLPDAAVAGCRSACLAFGSPQYCCTGEYGDPGTCKPSVYSEFFKRACPRAYSYAHDGPTSTFTCAAGDTSAYIITFCPSAASRKFSTSPNSQAPGTGGLQSHTGGAATSPWRIVLVVSVLGAVTAALGLLAKFLGLFKHCCNQDASAGGGPNWVGIVLTVRTSSQ